MRPECNVMVNQGLPEKNACSGRDFKIGLNDDERKLDQEVKREDRLSGGRKIETVINSGSVQREGGKKQKTEVRSESTQKHQFSGLFWGLGHFIRLATVAVNHCAKPAP